MTCGKVIGYSAKRQTLVHIVIINMEIPLAELGVVGAAIGALVWVVRAFLSHLKEKDSKFTETINNHMAHDTKAKERLAASHDKLVVSIDKLHDKLI